MTTAMGGFLGTYFGMYWMQWAFSCDVISSHKTQKTRFVVVEAISSVSWIGLIVYVTFFMCSLFLQTREHFKVVFEKTA